MEPALRGRAGGVLGLASLGLLAASIRWAHHRGPTADAVVGAGALATILALVVSIWSLATTGRGRRPAKLGVSLGVVSILALVLAALAYAAGLNAAGTCGGG